jgi:4-amino-4-deoxy-L-arabinose transferase-like glycosyltransferase
MQLARGVSTEVEVGTRWRASNLQLLAALVLVAAMVRWIGIAHRELWLDEAYSAWFSDRSWVDLWTSVPTYEPHPPLFYSLLKLWKGLWGSGLAGVRSLSVLFSVLAVPIVFAAALAHERLSPSGRGQLRAYAAALLMAVSPVLVWLGAEARPYPMLTFGYALAILALMKLALDFRDGSAGSWRWWALLAAGTELTLWSHGLGVLYAASLFSATLLLARPVLAIRRFWARGAAASAAIALLYLPCLMLMAARAADWSGSGWLKWKAADMLQLIALYSVPLTTVTLASILSAVLLLLLAKRAIGWSASRRTASPSDSTLLLLWLGPPALAILISVTVMPVFLVRTLSATLVPAYLAMGATLARTEARQERRLLTIAASILLTGAAIQTSLRDPAEEWNKVSSFLALNARPADQVWLYPNDSALPLDEAKKQLGQEYPARALPAPFPALGVRGPIRAGSPATVSLTREGARRLASESARQPQTIWLVTRQENFFDPDSDLRSALASVRRPGAAVEWGYIKVQPFYARPSSATR